MVEFFMSRPEADRYSREHGGEVYHHSGRKYWLIADRTAHGESFYAAHPYVVTDVLILDRVSVHKRYAVFGLLDNGKWNRIPGTYKSQEKAEEQIELHKMLIDALNRLERCAYSPLDIHWCIDTYTWLVRWKKIDAAEKERLAEQILAIQETQKFLREHEWKV